ncbi:hypothetical protein Xmau_03864 [Xenorhabdus mauleonii]|uniref:Uncharacterized protein n=1 Tax=Xenorhabdus mauleonii TaxID=351675 RepID=A0A1I3V5R3_9GAMM|nr:hypothetical protein [Xenorhabdus mauleonii]PHM37646.1 hypothetical protein Xmau_03864 [Xenorhabdus mauleonii]SFJ90768.1 hypothetical protein SAMN05421680_11968 [Xenorhabdus mauleonii]
MAKVLTEKEYGIQHLPAGWLSGLVTLCGQSDYSEDAISDIHHGDVTCDICRDMARVIFRSARLDEVEDCEEENEK